MGFNSGFEGLSAGLVNGPFQGPRLGKYWWVDVCSVLRMEQLLEGDWCLILKMETISSSET